LYTILDSLKEFNHSLQKLFVSSVCKLLEAELHGELMFWLDFSLAGIIRMLHTWHLDNVKINIAHHVCCRGVQVLEASVERAVTVTMRPTMAMAIRM
jgi:hypothetical protein